jgi:hypothetical protein
MPATPRNFFVMAAVAACLPLLVSTAAQATDKPAFVPDEVMRAIEKSGDVNARLPDGSTALIEVTSTTCPQSDQHELG